MNFTENHYPANYPDEVKALERHYINLGYHEHIAVSKAWEDIRNYESGKLIYSDIEKIITRTLKVRNYATDIVFHNINPNVQVHTQKDKNGLCSEIIVHENKEKRITKSGSVTFYLPNEIYKN